MAIKVKLTASSSKFSREEMKSSTFNTSYCIRYFKSLLVAVGTAGFVIEEKKNLKISISERKLHQKLTDHQWVLFEKTVAVLVIGKYCTVLKS